MSSIIHTPVGAAAARRGPALLYPALLIVGVAVIIASMLGIAAMTGLLSPAQPQPAAGRDGGKAAPPAAARCTDCAVSDSVHAIETAGAGTGAGAVAGARR